MSPYRDLDVLDAAELVEDQINRLIERSPRLLHVAQLRSSSHSIPANIGEGFGRRTIADRNRSLYVARGEANETIRHLRANFAARRLARGEYFQLRNRLQTIANMLSSLIGDWA